MGARWIMVWSHLDRVFLIVSLSCHRDVFHDVLAVLIVDKVC